MSYPLKPQYQASIKPVIPFEDINEEEAFMHLLAQSQKGEGDYMSLAEDSFNRIFTI